MKLVKESILHKYNLKNLLNPQDNDGAYMLFVPDATK